MNKFCRQSGRAFVLSFTAVLASTFLPTSSALATQTFNVKTYGAVGDGVTDDTNALKAALAAANASPGSTLLFPAGNYLYASNLTANGISIVGQRATLSSRGSDTSLHLTGSNVSVRDMTFAIQAFTVTVGLTVEDATGFKVNNNTFDSKFFRDIQISKSSNGEVQANKADLGSKSTLIFIDNASNVSIARNVASGDEGSSTFLHFNTSSDITVSSNRASGVATCVGTYNNSKVSCTDNTFSNYANGYSGFNDQNLTLSQNKFLTGSVVSTSISLSEMKNATVSDNTIQGANDGIKALEGSNLQLIANKINNTTASGIVTEKVKGLIVKDNIIKVTTTAILAEEGSNLTVTENVITQCQNAAIIGTYMKETETISKNTIHNCGLSSSGTTAVIYVFSPLATSIPITGNSYTGNATNLQYFIRCRQNQPPAEVSGNTTNTELPNLIGP